MTRILGIEIAADDKSTAAFSEVTASAQKFGTTVTEVADKNIERLSAQRAKLRDLAAAYGEVAASAQRGSDKQVIAAKLAADAQAKLDLQTRALGSSFTVTGARADKSSKSLTEVSREARGGIASFTGLGRAMFFASNAFLGGALIGGALKSVIDKTRATELAMGQLRIAVKDSGGTWAQDGAQIDAALKKQEELSQFTRAELAPTLTTLILSTGSVAKGEREMAIATDLARLKNEDLTTATRQVAQAGLGHTSVLRGLQIAIPPVTTAHDALKNELAQLKAKHEALTPAELAHANALAKSADQAATGARALDILGQKTSGADQSFSNSAAGGLAKFQRSLDDLEIAVGQTLMPEITKLVTSLSAWMDHLNKTGEAQKYAKETVDALKGGIDLARTAIHAVDDVTGSFKHTVELLLGLKVLSVLNGWYGGFEKLIGSRAAATGIAGAEVEAGGLLGTMGRLKALGPIGLTIALSFVPQSSKGQGLLNHVGAGWLGRLPIFGGIATQGAVLGEDLRGWLGMSQYQPYGPTAQGASELARQSQRGRGSLQSQIAALAKSLGLDPRAVLAVASAEGGFGHAIGDGGHAFGPFQLNNAGGVVTSLLGGINPAAGEAWALSPQGLRFALERIAKVARGKSGMAAVEAIVKEFERPKDGGAGDISRAYAYLYGRQGSSEAQIQNGASAGGGASAYAAANAVAVRKKHGIVSGANEIPAALQRQIDFTAEMVKKTQGETALEWVANEGDAIKAARAALEKKLAGQSGKQAAATQREIEALDKKLANLSVVSGAHLLPQSLQDSIAKFKTDAIGATGKAAENYLNDERRELEKAVAVLKGELNGAKGKQAAAIRKELNTIDTQVATVNKEITANLKAQGQAIKARAASAISQATQGITQAFSQIIADADSAFEQATQDYIDNTLGPQFYQGMQNPLEAQLAAMQAQDTVTSLQDALKQAKAQLAADTAGGADAATLAADKKAIIQAQRAIQENELSIQATELRKQEDAGYAAAVKQWTSDRALEEKRMNTALEDLAKGIGDGKQTIDGKGGLTDVLNQFGLTASAVADDDMKTLAVATATLAKVFADEAAALSGVGGTAAQKAANAALARAEKLGGGGGSSGRGGGYGGKKVPMLATGGDIRSAGLAYLHSGERVLPASVVNSPSGGFGGSITLVVNAPQYVGDKRDLAAAIKSPQVQEAVATAVILASRGGHIRQGDIRP